jgi:2-oxoisovalerate dehydrogenase E2 component (dihydrolipoyl transacylase)
VVRPVSRVKEFPLPDLGEGLTEGEILKWFVTEGDTVTQNQLIVEVETAKAAVEIPAKWAGKITKIFYPEGAVVEVGAPIIAIDTDPGAGELPPPPESPSAAPEAEIPSAEGVVEPGMIGGAAPGGRTAVLVGYGPRTTAAARRPRKSVPPLPAEGPPPSALRSAGSAATRAMSDDGATSGPTSRASGANANATATNGAAASVSEASTRITAKPPVRKLARDLGVDLHGLAGSGPSGSITREDVHAAVGAVPAASTAPVFGADREQRIPIKGVRKLMAENMVASAFTVPHVTEFLTIDMTRSMKALDRLRERPEWRGVRLSPLLLVAKAVLMAVERYPMINSSWFAETSEIVVKEYVNLGIAAATPRGLIVPNIKDAGRLSLRQLADAMITLAATAKDGRTSPADMFGGTFTITNVGVFGVDTGTPILPPGEAAILAFGVVREQPWVHKGKVKPRQVTTLGLSFDHRIIDGELGSRFLREVGDFLADPASVLLAGA